MTVNHTETNGHSILLGGLGGDSHSVGLTILRQALLMNNFKVHYIGTQNSLEDFFQLAWLSNVVMISCMDGHASYYLRTFPDLIKQSSQKDRLWYLGGNLNIGEGNGHERKFIDMGFNRVFVKFVDIATVIEILNKDLNSIEVIPAHSALWHQMRPSNRQPTGGAPDVLLELDAFERARSEVLDCWRTGRDAKDSAENARFLDAQPSFPKVQSLVHSGKLKILVQPRSGVPLVDEQIRLFKTFKDVGVKVLSYQVDSMTRNNNYAGADQAIRESRESGIATLNGFPVINHGVSGLRRVIQEVKTPLQTRHSTRDPRLLAEVSYAGGVTSFEGGAICYNIPYYKDYPLDQSIKNWQYTDRLTGLYHERYGIVLDREFFGTLTATLISPSLAIASNILEAILAVRQGVKCVSLGYAEQGHRTQDVAAIRMLGRMAAEILGNLGYKDIQINTVFHQYMAAFPPSRERAADLIYNSAITAALSGATRVIGKTPVEAIKIPTLEDNLSGIDLIMRGVADAAGIKLDEIRVAQECDIIRREAESIINSIIFCGHGDIAQGVIKGFEKGYMEIPFSPSVYNKGEVLMARDIEGAVRFLSFGKLQFDRELREFHRDKIAERRRSEKSVSEQKNYQLVERDVMQIARGEYEHWPLSR